MIGGKVQIGVRLVILQQNIVRRLEPFDQVGFKNQGFIFGGRHRDFQGVHLVQHGLNAWGKGVTSSCRRRLRQTVPPGKIGNNPFFQDLGLAYIQNPSRIIQKTVNTRT